MGSYASCYLGGFEVGSTKNDIDWALIGLFRETDKCVSRWPDQQLPRDYADWADELEPGETFEVVRYVAPLNVLRERLAINGFTLENASRLFVRAVDFEVDALERKLASGVSSTLVDHYKSELEVLKQLTPELWINNFRRIYHENPNRLYGGKEKHPEPTIEYMLRQEWHGCPGPERNIALRLAIEACNADVEIVYDLTDLVQGGWFSAEDNLVGTSIEDMADLHRSAARIIVLTEGKFDSRVLERSLNLLFPHLEEYYSFLDFDSVRYGGGSGNLVNTLKAFAGAGVSNRIIALFDNDTAAKSAILSLYDVPFPNHIRIIQLPEIELLRNYPTLGPSGLVRMDVNGLASSIELFLGKDVLQAESDLLPVQWTGFDHRLRRYQGEVVKKEEIQARFYKKLEARSGADGESWSDLRSVFASIFAAFDDYTLAQIERDLAKWYRQV